MPLRPVSGQEFEKGKLVKKVICLEEPVQSYALYLPSAFDPGRKWPILFLFDPGARGAVGVEAFRVAAYFDLAIAACEEGLFRERYLYFNRACVAAMIGDKKRALEFLSAAVDRGLSDIELLETTKEFDPIRNDARFREIMEKARKQKEASCP